MVVVVGGDVFGGQGYGCGFAAEHGGVGWGWARGVGWEGGGVRRVGWWRRGCRVENGERGVGGAFLGCFSWQWEGYVNYRTRQSGYAST